MLEHPLLDKSGFERAIRDLGGVPERVPGEYQRLRRAYDRADRAYHNAQHLLECFELLERWVRAARENHQPNQIAPEMVSKLTLALWYHDAVYRSKRSDNEARSARWFGVRALQWGLPTSTQEAIKQLILATQHGQRFAQSEGVDLMLDLDLAILASSPDRFDRYCAQIRAEYAWVPETQYREKRAQVLRQFLEQEMIFRSPFGAFLESQARQNLAAEIARLHSADGFA